MHIQICLCSARRLVGIDLNDETLLKEAVKRVSIFKREIIVPDVRKLKDQGLIEQTSSPQLSPKV